MNHNSRFTSRLRSALRILLVAISPALAASSGDGRLPLFFVPDQDLPGAGPAYSLRQGGLAIHFTSQRIMFDLGRETLRLGFLGARTRPQLEARDPQPGLVNYFVGARPETWRRNIPTYGAIAYRGLYPGIDLVYAVSDGRIKSEFQAAPGAEAGAIRWRYQGATAVKLDTDGSLVVATPGGELRERKPVLYQQDGGGRAPVEGGFQIFEDGSVGLRVGPYDRGRALAIDPVLSYSTYLGGSGMDTVRAIAVDSSGSAYVAGYTDSTGLPAAGAWQSASKGGVDAFVAKLNAGGTALVYCTYLGGSYDDRAFGIAVDSAGDAYVTGWTYSSDFPTTSGARQRILGGGRDAFVTKLNAAGNALVYSTFLGGSSHDTGNAIAIDVSGYAYVAGDTYSTNFPVLNGYQNSNAGRQDAFVAKLNPTGVSLIWSTYLGGYGDESAAALALDASGNVYVAGGTTSTNFPTRLALQSTSGGGQDAFVARLYPDGRDLAFSTYLGGSGGTASAGEAATAIGVDAAGSIYLAGYTSSANFPVLNARQPTHAGGTLDGFLAKLNPGATLAFSTYFGGSGADYVTGLAVASSGAVTLVGYTASSNLPVTSAIQQTKSGGYDAFAVRFGAAGDTVEFCSYLGGNDSDAGYAVATDASGSLWIAGQTLSSSFPVKSAIQAANAGGYSGFVSKISGSVPLAAFRAYNGNTVLTLYGSSSLFNAGGNLTSDIAVAQSASGDAFLVGRNDTTRVYMNIFKYDTQSWAGWVLAGDQKYGSPAVAAGANGEAFVAARDASNAYWITRYTPGAGFGGWVFLGGNFATDPVLARAPDGSIYVLGRDASGVVRSGRYLPASGFLGWFQANTSTLATGKPALTVGSDGAAYVAIRASGSNSIWMARLQADTWGPWYSGGGLAKTDPDLAATGGIVYVTVTNGYDQVYLQPFREGTGNGWQGWQFLNGVLTKAAIAATGGRYYVAGKTGSATLYWYQSGTGWTYLGYTGVPSSELSASPK
jgi:hypothetical protein